MTRTKTKVHVITSKSIWTALKTKHSVLVTLGLQCWGACCVLSEGVRDRVWVRLVV